MFTRNFIVPALIALAVILAACGPTTVTPVQGEERVTSLPYEQAFAETTRTITTQPYPSNTTGWVLQESDQSGGFISARISGQRCGFLGMSCGPYTETVSVAFARRGDETLVNISLTSGEPAADLANRIAENLGLNQ